MVKEIYLEEAAEIVLINPQTPGRKYPAPLFQRYLELCAMMLTLTE
jgi:hypothetical protein